MSSSKPADDPARALTAAALRYARVGVRSTRDVLTYLERRGASPQITARILADCRTLGLLNDRAAARLWAEQWARSGYAAAAIRLKLQAKGFGAQSSDEAAARAGSASDDEARAHALVAASLRRQSSRPGRAQRLARVLASRGFDPDLIERVLARPHSS